jgi:hypothetical protein
MDFNQSKKVIMATPPAAIVDNAAVVVAEVDTKGFRKLEWLILLGASDIAVAAMKATHGDTAGSGHVDISGGDFSVLPATLPSATDDNKIFSINIDLLGKKRYHDLVLTGGDGTAGAFFAVIAILSRPEEMPDSVTEKGYSQQLNC